MDLEKIGQCAESTPSSDERFIQQNKGEIRKSLVGFLIRFIVLMSYIYLGALVFFSHRTLLGEWRYTGRTNNKQNFVQLLTRWKRKKNNAYRIFQKRCFNSYQLIALNIFKSMKSSLTWTQKNISDGVNTQYLCALLLVCALFYLPEILKQKIILLCLIVGGRGRKIASFGKKNSQVHLIIIRAWPENTSFSHSPILRDLDNPPIP